MCTFSPGNSSIIKRIITISAVVIAAACSPYTVTRISVMVPGNAKLSSDVKTLSLAMVQNEHTMPAGRLDSINNLKLDPGFNYYMLAKDLLYGMRDILTQSPKFNEVRISKHENFSGLYASRDYDWSEITRICRNDSSDALLVIESVLLNDSLRILPFEESCYAEYRMESSINYSILYPKHLEVVYKQSDNHSLTFSEIGYDCNYALNLLPEGGDLIVQIFYETGQKAVAGLAPEWKDNIKRVYYSGSHKLLRQGAVFARKDLWIEAAEYWRKAVDINKNNISARAAFNMALVCEMQDLPEVALTWIEMSDSLKRTDLSGQYRKIIETRVKHHKHLDKQMGVE